MSLRYDSERARLVYGGQRVELLSVDVSEEPHPEGGLVKRVDLTGRVAECEMVVELWPLLGEPRRGPASP